MNFIPQSSTSCRALVRRVSVAAMLSWSLSAGFAASAAEQSASAEHSHHYETVDQRIDSLHKSLKITADEETAWSAVALAMRDNEAAMQKLVATNNAQSAQRISAVDDLKIYESFTQAHVDGLKNLIASFQTLYSAMPDAQKEIADGVFQRFGHKGAKGIASAK